MLENIYIVTDLGPAERKGLMVCAPLLEKASIFHNGAAEHLRGFQLIVQSR